MIYIICKDRQQSSTLLRYDGLCEPAAHETIRHDISSNSSGAREHSKSGLMQAEIVDSTQKEKRNPNQLITLRISDTGRAQKA